MNNTKYEYASLSGYDEINQVNRKLSADAEVDKWGLDKDKFKFYRMEWDKSSSSNYLPNHPLHVDIELSDACNLRCKMCAHGFGTIRNVGFMKEALAKKIIDDCVKCNVYSIKFNWRGEPTLSPFLSKLTKYAKDKGILEVQINTNGQNLNNNSEVFIQCAENGMDRIIFSIDGFSKETYESIRIGGSYERVLQNVHKILEWKRKNEKIKPFIRVQMVRTTINAHEVDEYIKYWQPLVDDVRISDVTDRGQSENLAVGDIIAVGRKRCPQPFQRLTIGRDGRVSPCCSDWYQELIVGSIQEQSLMEIWKGKKIEEVRNIQRTNQLNSINVCRNCYVKESYIWKNSKDLIKENIINLEGG
jgi:radical SAM protein with 4Fe4S-binding SPASM domain